MAGYPPPYPPPPQGDWRYQRKLARQQARMQQDVLRAQRAAYREQLRGRARGSIVGPLLVVAVGVVFLLVQMGRISAAQVWSWYGRWWPLLLVGAGALLLAEWGIDQFGESKGPRRSVGSGVVFLLVLLAITGITFRASGPEGPGLFAEGLHLDPDNLNEFLGDKHESDQTFVEPLGPGAAVTFENPRGDVSVSGTSDDGQLHLQLHREIYSRSDSEASSKSQQLVPVVTKVGTGLSVRVPVIDGARADISVLVPATVAETITADHGDVRVNLIQAPIAIVANHGDIDLATITGAVTAHINHGDASLAAHNVIGTITVAGKGRDVTLSDVNGAVNLSGDFFGTTHLERVAGNVLFRTSRTDLQLGHVAGEVDISPNADLSASEIVGPVVLNTRNRNITLDRVSGDITVTNRNGSVDVVSAMPLGNVTIENRNGSVDLTVPGGSGFVVDAETTDGDLSDEFSLSVAGGEESRKSIRGTVGQGGPGLRINTTQGDISLKRGSDAGLPATVPTTPVTLGAATGSVSGSARAAETEAGRALAQAARELRDDSGETTKPGHKTKDAAHKSASSGPEGSQQ